MQQIRTLQAALTVTLRSKNAFSVKLRPLNISVKNRVWELSSMTVTARTKCETTRNKAFSLKPPMVSQLSHHQLYLPPANDLGASL